MESEGLVRGIPGRGGLEPANVAAMTQLGLRIAADKLVGFGRFQEAFMLLGGALIAESNEEHAVMQPVRCALTD